MSKAEFTCIKCSDHNYKTGQIRTTGGGLSRFLNIQNNKFNTLSCVKCGYTEIYRTDSGTLGNILDIFTN